MAEIINTIVNKYEIDLSNYKAGLKDLSNNLKTTSNEVSKSAKDTSKAFDESSKSLGGMSNALGLVTDQIPYLSQIKTIASAMGSGFEGATKAVGGMSKAMGVLRGTIIASGIGALVYALGSLVAMFKASDQGATKFDGVMKGLGNVTDMVIGKMGTFAEKALSDLNTALNDSTSALSQYSKELEKNNDHWTSWLSLQGLAYKALKQTEETFGEAIDQGMEYAKALDEISDAMRTLSVDVSVSEQEINRLIKTLKNRDLTAEQRLNNLATAEKIETDITNKQIENQKKLYVQELKNLILKTEYANADNPQYQQRLKNIKALADETLSVEQLVAQYKAINNVLESGKNADDKYAQSATDNLNKLIVLNGKYITNQEKYEVLRANLRESNFNDELAKLNTLNNLRQADALKRISDQNQLEAKLYSITQDSLNKEIELRKKFGKDTSDLVLKIAENRVAYEKKISEDLEKEAQKQLADAKAREEKRLKDLEASRKENLKIIQSILADEQNAIKQNALNVKQSDDELNKALLLAEIDYIEKTKDARIAFGEDRIAIEKRYLDAKIELNKIDVKNTEETEKQKKAIREQALQSSIQAVTLIQNAFAERQKAQIQNDLNYASAQTDQKIQNAQREYEAGLISQEQYLQAKTIFEQEYRAKEREARRKEAEINKQSALFDIALNTAVAVSKVWATTGPGAIFLQALPIAMGALQAAIVIARPLPQFADGVIGFKGKGTGTSDDNPVMISNGESIIKAKQTLKHREALEAINDNTFDDYISRRHLMPYIKKMKNVHAQSNIIDMSRLEELTKRNRSVSLNNANEIGKAVARNLKSGKYEL